MIYLYILTMALVTYLIRMLPLTIFQKKIRNRYMRSLLYYIPYACLMAMTFPGVLYATDNMLVSAIAVVIAIILALCKQSLAIVALFSCLSVFILNLMPWFHS